MLLYGPGGTGKTFFGGTVGKDGIIISIGGGESTFASKAYIEKYKSNAPRIEILSGTDYEQRKLSDKPAGLDIVTDTIDRILDKNEAKTIVIDDATFLSKLALTKGLYINAVKKRSATFSQAKDDGFILSDIADAGTEINIVDWFIATYTNICRQKDVNLILLAHERITYKKAERGLDSYIDKIYPGFTGRTFPHHIGAYFDFVWHSEIKSVMDKGLAKTQFGFRTIPNEIITAKTRVGGYFNELEFGIDFQDVCARLNSI